MASGRLLGVTGASGRVGRHLCEEALRRGYRVRALGRSQEGLPPAVEHVVLDLESVGAIASDLLSGCDALIHLAAYIPKDHGSLAEGRKCWDVNVAGTARLIEAAAAANVGFVLQFSSANSYAPWSKSTDEAAPLFPRSRTFYLSSKIAQEICGAEIAARLGLKLATLRVSSVYDADPSSNLIARFTADLLAGKPLKLTDAGRFGADFVFVDDVVRAAFLVLEVAGEGSWNVASGVRSTLSEIADLVVEITGADPSLVERLPPGIAPDQGFPAIQIGRLTSLGYRPISLENGIETLISRLRTLES